MGFELGLRVPKGCGCGVRARGRDRVAVVAAVVRRHDQRDQPHLRRFSRQQPNLFILSDEEVWFGVLRGRRIGVSRTRAAQQAHFRGRDQTKTRR